MSKKTLYAVGGVLVALFVLGGIATAAGIGPFGVKLGAIPAEIQNLIKGPERLPANNQLTGCDQSATSTDCATIRTSEPAEQTVNGFSTDVAATGQSGKIDARLTIDNTYKSVDVCGVLYRGKQVVIDGVDVLQRIAALGRAEVAPHRDIGTKICDGIKPGPYGGKKEVEISEVISFPGSDVGLPGIVYQFNISDWRFAVAVETGDIYGVSGYDGSLLGPIGKLK
jgi:hypothetical protein